MHRSLTTQCPSSRADHRSKCLWISAFISPTAPCYYIFWYSHTTCYDVFAGRLVGCGGMRQFPRLWPEQSHITRSVLSQLLMSSAISFVLVAEFVCAACRSYCTRIRDVFWLFVRTQGCRVSLITTGWTVPWRRSKFLYAVENWKLKLLWKTGDRSWNIFLMVAGISKLAMRWRSLLHGH